MPTVIDALTVTLGLDTSGFKKGQADTRVALKGTSEEAEVMRKRHEVEAKKVTEAYNSVKRAVLGFTEAVIGAVAGGAFLGYLKNINNADAALGRLAKNTGTSAQELKAWINAAEGLGSTAADIEGGFRNIVDILQLFKTTGDPGVSTPFSWMRVNLGKFLDNKTSMDERMRMLNESFSRMSPFDAQTRGKEAGFGEGFINMMMRNRNEVNEAVRRASNRNAVTPENVDMANQRQQAMAALQARFEDLSRKILTMLTPKLLEAMDKLDIFFDKHGDQIAAGISKIGSAVNDLANSFNKLDGPLSKVYDKLAPIMSKLGFTTSKLKRDFGYKDGGISGTDFTSSMSNGETPNFQEAGKKAGLPIGLLPALMLAESNNGENAQGSSKFITNIANALSRLLKKYHGNIDKALAEYSTGKNIKGMNDISGEAWNYIDTVKEGMGYKGGNSGSTSSTDIKINNLTINTKATDARGIAADISKELRNQSFSARANYGVN